MLIHSDQKEAIHQLIIESSSQGVLMVNKSKIQNLNRAVLKIFGYTQADELIGKSPEIFIHPNDRQKLLGKMEDTCVPDKWSTHEIEGIHKSGKPLFLEIQAGNSARHDFGADLYFITDLTHRKNTETELIKKEKRYRELLDNLIGGYYELDLKGTFTFINKSAANFFGLTPDQLVGQKNNTAGNTEAGKKLSRVYNQVFQTGQTARGISIDATTLDGRMINLEMVISLLKDENGRPAGFSVLSVDRTEQRKMEKALLESEEKYRTILETIEDGYYEVDLKGRLKFFNKAMAQINGYPPDEMMGMHARDYAADERDVAHLDHEFSKVFFSGRSEKGIQYQVVTKEGQKKFLQTSASLLKNAAGKIIGFKGIARDISDLKLIQIALQESEERHRTIFNTSPDAIAFFDMNYTLVIINPMGCKLFGYGDQSEIAGASILKFIPPDMQSHAVREFQKSLNAEVPYNDELFLLKKDGTTFPLEIRSSVLKDNNEQHKGFVILARDITKRKEAEKILKNSHNRISLLINSISSILIAVSENGTIDFWNTEAENQFGYKEKKVLGKQLSDLNIKWDWPRIAEGLSRCRKERRSIRLDDLKFTQANGKEGFLGIRLGNLFSRSSVSTAILIQGVNTTDRRILESQLSQAQKLEAIGQLAAGIAHEINTPSQYVGDNTHFLKNAFADLKAVIEKYEAVLTAAKTGRISDRLIMETEKEKEDKDLGYLLEDIPNAIKQSLEGIERITSIVLSIKEFSHPDQKEKTGIDVNKSLESTITVARNEWKYVAEMETHFAPDLPLLWCYSGELNQVFLNMIINAAHAIEEKNRHQEGQKGKITISTESTGTHIIIKIKDNGTGMSHEIQQKIFDPFFTTKEVGKGTGQGLAISHTVIVEKHGGSIMVNSKAGEGSEFVIRLPIDDKNEFHSSKN